MLVKEFVSSQTTVDAAEEDDNGTSTLTSDAREHGGRVATTVSMVTTERPPSTPGTTK